MNKKRIAIIGGGAVGLFAATMLNDLDAEICIFEKNSKLGKKILASGNGKCNFTNVSNLENKYNNEFANRVIDKFGVKETLKAFSNMGLIYKNDGEGRCYPISETATSVLDCLKLNLSKVKIRLDSTVDSISYEGASCVVSCGGKREKFDYVVCCSGSKASNLGSDKAYLYLENLGLKFNSLKGSLVPLVLKENVKSMSGVRIKCIVKLLDENNVVKYMENGEVIFKDKGISGIAIFNASSYINRNRSHKYKISLDLSNGMNDEELINYFKSKDKENIFKGFLNDKIGEYLFDLCDLNSISYIDMNVINKIIKNIKDLTFSVEGMYPLLDSQVCSGGVCLSEVDEDLRLRKYPSIYVGGELLDVDGVCGGYNLQFAWSSAGVIANDIKRRMKD